MDVETPSSRFLFETLQAEFGDAVSQGMHDRFLTAKVAGQENCDVVMYSEAAPRFSLQRVLPRLASNVIVAFVSAWCILEEAGIATSLCNHANLLWEKTALRRGACKGPVCMTRVASEALEDPNILPLNCSVLDDWHGSASSTAEFGQDWYLHWNFLQHGAVSSQRQREIGSGDVTSSKWSPTKRIYVDVGASFPYEYSNTVLFDRCLGWQGLCVEPNPHMSALLDAYRSCQVVRKCVDDEVAKGKPFWGRDGSFEFAVDCMPLGEILRRAGLQGRRIDLLSIDVEHAELRVLRGLPIHEYDIRTIVVEVSTGVRWLEVDAFLIPQGYAKVAVLGRDVVYVKLEELRIGGVADWPEFMRTGRPAALPDTWTELQELVIKDEQKQEDEREEQARQRGLRRGA
eukprot:TRINITY_DN37936_c0_g1_i1.p1 TRINITY_DN37936_c0_g1~~TRINITY_DN37936_c0_g1_i1.p1  ORF type:complete len:401 (-),score=62.05 TRINITY_DN37936_c0_g1_i1:4-1206(-)